MSVEHLPWDSLEGPIYHARELKPRKQWVTYGCWILSAALIIGGIVTPYRVAAVFGVLYILTLLMKKIQSLPRGDWRFLSDEDYHTL